MNVHSSLPPPIPTGPYTRTLMARSPMSLARHTFRSKAHHRLQYHTLRWIQQGFGTVRSCPRLSPVLTQPTGSTPLYASKSALSILLWLPYVWHQTMYFKQPVWSLRRAPKSLHRHHFQHSQQGLGLAHIRLPHQHICPANTSSL